MPSTNCTLLPSPDQAKRWLEQQREKGKTIGFVATMGALHQGHLSLVKRATQENDLVCVSIFVNPLQFNNPDDLENYPRDIQQDVELLETVGCDMVFTGTLRSFFPHIEDLQHIPLEDPGSYAQDLEGAFRPGHFAGVKTIVKRLFETVGTCRAYFGAKDYQQTLVVKSLNQEIDFVEIVVCPTEREASGLAMSSRNQRLSAEEKNLAAQIYQALIAAQAAWQKGEQDKAALINIMQHQLVHPKIDIEYTELRNPDDWLGSIERDQIDYTPIALIAVNIGTTRLIDNLTFESTH